MALLEIIIYNITTGLKMIKLLATDLDGTLFYPKRRTRGISSKNKKFLKEFVQRGNTVVVVSGRNYEFCKKISKKVNAPISMIGCNGSVIYKDNEFFSDDPMDHEEIKEFYTKNKFSDNVVAWVFMSDRYPLILVPVRLSYLTQIGVKFYLHMQGFYKDRFVFGEKHLFKMLNDSDARIYKMMAMYGVGKKKIEIARLEKEKFFDAYSTKFEILWSRESIEFMKKGVNKANALKNFINVLQIKEDDVAVVGDSGNDVPLFEAFKNSFVMQHAPEEVKSKAKTQIEGVYCIQEFIN